MLSGISSALASRCIAQQALRTGPPGWLTQAVMARVSITIDAPSQPTDSATCSVVSSRRSVRVSRAGRARASWRRSRSQHVETSCPARWAQSGKHAGERTRDEEDGQLCWGCGEHAERAAAG
jgi:hypothetical protein